MGVNQEFRDLHRRAETRACRTKTGKAPEPFAPCPGLSLMGPSSTSAGGSQPRRTTSTSGVVEADGAAAISERRLPTLSPSQTGIGRWAVVATIHQMRRFRTERAMTLRLPAWCCGIAVKIHDIPDPVNPKSDGTAKRGRSKSFRPLPCSTRALPARRRRAYDADGRLSLGERTHVLSRSERRRHADTVRNLPCGPGWLSLSASSPSL